MIGSARRIGLVGPVPPPAGGMATQTLQLLRLLMKEGHTVTFVPVNPPYFPNLIGKVKGARAIWRLLPYLVRLWRLSKSVDVIHLMANSGWSWHLFSAPVLLVAGLRGCPVVVNYRGGEAERFFNSQFKIVWLSLRFASRIMVPSGFLKELFGRFGCVAEVVPNVVDLDLFSPVALRSDITNSPRLIVMRQLEAIYDNASAINALAKIKRYCPDASLVIAGVGPEADSLGALVQSLNLESSVQFCGTLSRDEVVTALGEADIFINPSLADNMPNSVLEALASGLPVVSTNVGGIPYIVNNEQTALLVNPSRPDEIANAVLRLVADRALRESLSRNGVEAVRRFSWSEVSVQLMKIYEEAAVGSRKA